MSEFRLVRPAAVAGRFYPAGARQLHAEISRYLAGVTARSPLPKAIIVPHAGYVYSGPVAASAFAQLAPGRGLIRRVVMLGPAHRVAVDGLATCAVDAFCTPLGEVPLDRPAVDALLQLPFVNVLDAAHELEHCLEVQLPFLQEVLGEFAIVPLVVGRAGGEQIKQVLDLVWGGDETLILISSDLSHYHHYDQARQLDAQAAAAIEALAPEQLGENQACGRIPIRGLLAAARQHHLQAHTLDLRNSGDTAGPRDQVVGYGAWAFTAG